MAKGTVDDGAKDDTKGGGSGAGAGVGGGPGGAPSVDGSSAAGKKKGGPAQLAVRIGELEQQLAEAQRALDAGALERRIESVLMSSGAIDAETVRVLIAHELELHPGVEIERAVASLKRRKPFLFASGTGPAGGAALAPRGAPVSEADELASMHSGAMTSGDRGALLRYLRARRAG